MAIGGKTAAEALKTTLGTRRTDRGAARVRRMQAWHLVALVGFFEWLLSWAGGALTP